MQRRTHLFLALAAGIAGTLVLLRWQGDDVAPPDGPVAPAAPDPGLPAARDAQDPQPAPAGSPRVRVEVVAVEQYVAPSPARVQAVRAVDGSDLPTALLAGAGAGFDATPRAAGVALAAIEHDEGRLLRQATFAAGEVGRLSVGARLVVRGRVVGVDGKPVAGATVWFGEFDREGNRREVAVLADGSYEAQVLAGTGVPFVVRAPGAASQWRVVGIVVPPAPCDAVLERACVLEVQLAAAALEMASARVFVVPRASVSTTLAQWPFFAQVLADGHAVDEQGRAVVGDLPRNSEVGIVVRHPRALLTAAPVVLRQEERVRAVVPLEFLPAAWQGTVVDEAGEPLSGVAVFARRAAGPLEPGTSQRLVPPHLEGRGVCWTWTAATGAFVLGAPAAAGGTLSLRGAGRAGRDIAWSAAVPGSPIVLPAWRGGEFELRLLPPRAGTVWSAEADLGGGVRDVVAADQPWRVSLPHAGRFDCVLTTFVGDEVRARERHADVHVTGPIELPSPRLP